VKDVLSIGRCDCFSL